MAASTSPDPNFNSRPLLAIVLRLVAVALISAMFVFVRLASDEGVSIIEALFWRQLTAVPIILVWLGYAGQLAKVKTNRPAAHATRMAVGIFAMSFNYWAYTLLPLAEATSIGFAVPILGTLFAALLLKEDVGIFRWAAVVVGFVGVLVVLQPFNGHIDPFGGMVALSGAVATALASIQIRSMAKTEGTLTIVFWFSVTSLLPLGTVSLYLYEPHSALAWGYIAGLSLCGAGVQMLVTTSLKFGNVSTIMTMDYTTLLWSTFFGYLFFAELPQVSTWIGAPIIVGAGLFIVWREHRKGVSRVTQSEPAGH